jgi:transposase
MWHVGIDLHKRTVVIAAVNDSGQARAPVTIECRNSPAILAAMEALKPFRAVIEASATYRWLYDLLTPFGTVLVAHPLRLRAMVQRRSKTDKLDAQLLANLLRINQVPLSYVPDERYHFLREIMRHRVRLGRALGWTKGSLTSLLNRHNMEAPYVKAYGPRGIRWFEAQDFGPADNVVCEDCLSQLSTLREQETAMGERVKDLCSLYPEVEALRGIYGIGAYLALVIVGEIGDVERFREAGQVGAYAGLTATVNQSGGHCYQGHISRQGSQILRWALVQVAMKVIRKDVALGNFYARIRKRGGAKKARVAVARKLAEICWIRLRRWHRERGGQPVMERETPSAADQSTPAVVA